MLRKTLSDSLRTPILIAVVSALGACGEDAPVDVGGGRDAAAETDGETPDDDAGEMSTPTADGGDADEDASAPRQDGGDAGDGGSDANDGGDGDASDGGPDAGQGDAGESDAGGPDAGDPDAGDPDAGELDAGEPDGGPVLDPAAPRILEDLASALTVGEGQPLTLSVAATSGNGSPLSYQWTYEGSHYGPASANASLLTPSMNYRHGGWEERWQVAVSNSAGTVTSHELTLTRTARSWRPAEVAFSEAPVATNGVRPTAMAVDSVGRVHVASSQRSGSNYSLRIEGYSQRYEGDSWSYSSTFAVSGPAVELKLASMFGGTMMLIWREPVTGQPGQDAVVKAALYSPNDNPALPGTWQALGIVHDAGANAASPELVTAGGAYAIAWVEGAPGSRNVRLRSYVPQAAGTPVGNGWVDAFAAEGVAGDYARVQLVSYGTQVLAFMYRADGASSRWQYSFGNYAQLPTTPVDLAADARFSRVYASAADMDGRVLLAIEDGTGRVFTRFARFASADFAGGWTYTANAYGSAPVPLLYPDGSGDVFGVAVNTSSQYTSSLAQWHYTPGSGWGSATILASDSGDFRAGYGFRGVAAGSDDQGNLVLTWLHARSNGSFVCGPMAQRFSAYSRTWSNPVQIAAVYAPCEGIDLSVPQDGSGTAVWSDVDETHRTLMQARLR